MKKIEVIKNDKPNIINKDYIDHYEINHCQLGFKKIYLRVVYLNIYGFFIKKQIINGRE